MVYARTDIGGAYRWNAAAKRWMPLLEGNPFVHYPTFEWEITGAELLQGGSLRRELGGT